MTINIVILMQGIRLRNHKKSGSLEPLFYLLTFDKKLLYAFCTQSNRYEFSTRM